MVAVAVVMVAVAVVMVAVAVVMVFVHHSVGFEQTHAQEKGQRHIPLH